MNELLKTLLFCLAAGALAVAAVMVDPAPSPPEVFDDQGELFYPDFTDPQAPKAIEVVDYDEDTATARPLKVEFKDNKWTIPSHHNYPADAENRLANTAAALMELRKDIFVSDRVEDHGEFGVIDPLDQASTTLAGRGQRVTLRDENGGVLADFIVGKEVEDKPGFRYMRVPSQRRVYAVKTDAQVSARFVDWIETDLLKLNSSGIRRIDVNRYSINEQVGRLENEERLTLKKSEDKWTTSGEGEPKEEKVKALTDALENLRIVDVQPKPDNLTRDLKTPEGIQLSMESAVLLRQKGFFLTRAGKLLSNEGEVIVDTANGLRYTLRFGEIASGGASSGPSDEADQAESGDEQQDKGERRYLFITVDYSEDRAKQYAGEEEPDSKGKELAEELRNRFADWYYVITGADFNNLRPRRSDLVRQESPQTTEAEEKEKG